MVGVNSGQIAYSDIQNAFYPRTQAADTSEQPLALPSEESLAAITVLQAVAIAAKNAVTLSTGEGTESSGQGRYEWGTWCNTDLFERVKEALNDVVLTGSPELWEVLWPLVGGVCL